MEVSLTKKEAEIMRTLWKAGKPLMAKEFSEINPELNLNTLQTVLKKLLTKNYICISGADYSGNVLARKYGAVLNEWDYISSIAANSTIMDLVTQFISDEASPEQIEKIEETIKAKKEEL